MCAEAKKRRVSAEKGRRKLDEFRAKKAAEVAAKSASVASLATIAEAATAAKVGSTQPAHFALAPLSALWGEPIAAPKPFNASQPASDLTP
eukprot:9415430-Pyramimonas_sp.AAC.2